MKLRTIHHLPCSGGALICKAIQSMHNTQVLSEIHPDILQHKFNPFDPTQLLLGHEKLKKNLELRRRIFANRLNECYGVAENINLNLVLREYTFVDYIRPKKIKDIKSKTSLLDMLPKYFDVLSTLSIRDPIESYISLQMNGWSKNIANFDDYCRRFELMIEIYSNLGSNIIRYEDFCNNPQDTMIKICNFYDLVFNENFEDSFFENKLSGDSGRGKLLNQIQVLTPKEVSHELKNEALASEAYMRISNMFDYGNGIIR